ncbi:hypothetical protein [Ruminococcus sp.]|uniref:hypothetical protein n=1 Tax=Ruminococcus sp. TaxID=41978 RepID=UPI002E80FF85|nr:hypothetical protein [Ruminococcus sp.]MEE3492183.1 hypothetical protein [Ruminococcus sp.]
MEKYKFDFTTKTLTITKAFVDKAITDPESDENKVILRFKNDFPDLRIKYRTHKTPSKYHTKSGEVYNCNQFKNLTYENMETFISALPNSDELMKNYAYLRYVVGKVQTNTYKLVREWFVAQFPKYRKDPLFYIQNEVKVIDINDFTEQDEKKGA